MTGPVELQVKANGFVADLWAMHTITELQAPDRYVFDNAWEHARRRLALLEQCTDASTIRRLFPSMAIVAACGQRPS
ncbi:MAG: hypothetical protein M3228_01785 [Actinomycetota bacterium]|nr:hypothetical protein [Actinomycetota bacterium]